MNKLKNDTRDISLTAEFIEKSDKDIATIAVLDEYAKITGNILVLSGGYTTEVLCGGKITRAHGDIDAHLILTGEKSTKEIFPGIQKLLSKEETEWKMYSQKPDKFEFREDASEKKFDAKRRLELRLNEPHENNIQYPKEKLINSNGKEIEVTVVDLTETVIQKLSKFYSLRNGVDTNTDRHSSRTDFIDLNRLLAQERLNKEE